MDQGDGRPSGTEIIALLDAPRPSLSTVSSSLARASPRDAVAALKHWVRRSDAPEQLLRRGWMDGWLWPTVEAVWAADPEDPLAELREESMLWVALSSLGGQFSGLTFTQGERIAAFASDPRLHRGRARDHSRRVTEAAVEAFRTPYVQKRTVQFGGWLYILSAAAAEKFRSRDHPAALAHAREAWSFRHGLPRNIRSAKAIVHVANQIATVSAHMRDGEATTRLEEALAGLDEAQAALDDARSQNYDGVAGAVEHLSIALSRENVFRRMSIWNLLPFLDSVEMGTQTLVAGFERFREITGLPSLDDLASGAPMTGRAPSSTHPAVLRALMRLAHCASRSGDWDLGARAMAASGRFTRGDVQEWDWAIMTAFETSDPSQRLDRMEQLLRFAEHPTSVPPLNRSVLLTRSADAARDASRSFYREKLFTSAWFWAQVSVEWSKSARALGAAEPGPPTANSDDEGIESPIDQSEAEAGSELPDSTDARVPAAKPVALEHTWSEPEPEPDTAPGPQQPLMTGLIERLRGGVPLAVILQLYRLGKQLNTPVAAVDPVLAAEVVTAVEGWERPRRIRGEKRPDVDPTDAGALHEWMLLSASELAAVYAPHLLPEIHLGLAKSLHLDAARRLSHAQLCTHYAREARRPNYVSAGLFDAVKIAVAMDDEALVESQVRELLEAIGAGSTWSARGADLVETAYWSGRRTEKLIEMLLREGYPQFAMQLFDANEGRLHHSFRSIPAFATELQLMERNWGSRSREDEDELFRRIRARVLAGETFSIDESPTAPDGDHSGNPDEAVVRLFTFGTQSWALISMPADGEQRFEVVELEIGESQVAELADVIWYQLRPTRSSKPATALGALHDAIVGPILERVRPGLTLLFHPQGAMSMLPLHAALGPDGYAIERHPIAYYPTDQAEGEREAGQEWLVCGWDVSAHAEREARQVARLLRQRGHSVELPSNANEGLKRLLSASTPVEMVHVSGHGQSVAWPRSFQSTIALSPRMQLTAGDWLTSGPRAAFVFLNVCGVGRVKPYGGDLNGFPLALRIRGAHAIVAANGFIPPADAHRFAERFYTHSSSDDTLTAYRAAVQESIGDGVAVGGWAPYAHFGRGYRLGGRSAA